MSAIPAMPGLIYLAILSVIFGFIDGFQLVTLQDFYILAAILFTAIVVDFVAGFIGAKVGGAKMKSIAFGALGLVIGTIAIPIPPLGSMIGFFLGIFLSEYFQNRHHADRALKAALSGLIGTLIGTTFNVLAAILFVVLFIYFVFFG